MSESAWWEDYYIPLHLNIENFKEKHKFDSKAISFAQEEEMEIELFQNYSGYYGCVFYIMQTQTISEH